MKRATILGVDPHLPPRMVTHDELAQRMNTSDEWITQRSDIKERRYVDAGVGSKLHSTDLEFTDRGHDVTVLFGDGAIDDPTRGAATVTR